MPNFLTKSNSSIVSSRIIASSSFLATYASTKKPANWPSATPKTGTPVIANTPTKTLTNVLPNRPVSSVVPSLLVVVATDCTPPVESADTEK